MPLAPQADFGAESDSGGPGTSEPGRRVLAWFGWTLLYVAACLGSAWLASSVAGESAVAVVVALAAMAAAAYLIGHRFRSDAWPLGPLFAGIGLPGITLLYFAVAPSFDPESLGLLWVLMLAAALVWLVPLSAIMAAIAWLGVRHGKRRALAGGAGLPAATGPDAGGA